jgi:RNA polymerase sigma factor (sigma-70 family)
VNTKQLTDQELIHQFLSGNQYAFEVLAKRYKSKLFNYILMLVKDRQLAEDLLQDTLIKVIRSLKTNRYKDDNKFSSWLMRIAHNLVIDYFRKQKQLKTISNDNYESDLFNTTKLAEDTIEEKMIEEQINKELHNLIGELPDDQQQIVYLRHFEGLSFKEIADMTDVSINTALGRMRYALINMRRLMEKNNMSLTKS